MMHAMKRISLTAALALLFPLAAFAQAPDGADLYKRSCGSCHETTDTRAPHRDAFRSMTPGRVLASMETAGGELSVMPRPANSSQLTLAPPLVATK